MQVLVVNAGSSSLRLRVLGPTDEAVAAANVRLEGNDTPAPEIESFVAEVAGVDAVGHRVVHGGPDLRRATVVDDAVLERIEAQAPLAPLHQARAVAGIRALRAVWPDIPAVACFDTAFHATLPAAAATYALPRQWRESWGLTRYGFHGLSHAYAVRRAAEVVGRELDGLRVVSCHLGAGSSLCATIGGRSVDTTMGFTPLEGLVMATRSGSVDPGLVLWLLRRAGLSADEVAEGLERASGLAGLAGGTGDVRHVVAAAAEDDTAALALGVYLHRLRREVAAMAAATNGVDVLVFTGGVGEHQPVVRAAAAEGLAFLGVHVNRRRNEAATGDADISANGADTRTVVVTAREDLEIARQVRSTLADPRPADRPEVHRAG